METKQQDFMITRVFNAPRELVWKAHTEADRLMHWWGPKGFKMLKSTIDLRPGGMFHYGMQSPNGEEMWGKFIYREVRPQEKLVFIVSFSDKHAGITRHPMAPTWPLEMLNTLILTEHEGKTTLTLTGRPVNATEEERNMFYGAFESMNSGFGGTYDQLEEYLTLSAN